MILNYICYLSFIHVVCCMCSWQINDDDDDDIKTVFAIGV